MTKAIVENSTSAEAFKIGDVEIISIGLLSRIAGRIAHLITPPDYVWGIIRRPAGIDRLASCTSNAATPIVKSRKWPLVWLLTPLLMPVSSCLAQADMSTSATLPSYLFLYDSIAPTSVSKPVTPIGAIDPSVRPASASVNSMNAEDSQPSGISPFQATDDHKIARPSPLAFSQVIQPLRSAGSIMRPLAEYLTQATSPPSFSSSSFVTSHKFPDSETRMETSGGIWHLARADVNSDDSHHWHALDLSANSESFSSPLLGFGSCGLFTNATDSACIILRHTNAHLWSQRANPRHSHHLNKKPLHQTNQFARSQSLTNSPFQAQVF